MRITKKNSGLRLEIFGVVVLISTIVGLALFFAS